MARMTMLAVAIVLAFATPALAQRHGEARHSGTIAEISPDGHTIVLEEVLAWQGPEAPGIVRRPIALTPDTSMQLVERTGRWGEARTSRPGWESETIQARDLKPGDFVTVTLRGGERPGAVALEVIRPQS